MRVIRENEWAILFEMESGTRLTKSRFLEDTFVVPAQRIIANWKTMSNRDQLEFLRAFHVRWNLKEEDQRILDFLMEIDDPRVWVMISPLMPKYHNRQRALEFLLEKVARNSEGLANCYHALEAMNDAEAVPVLRTKFNGYMERFSLEGNRTDPTVLIDYAYCCAALRTLEPERSEEYTAVLRALDRVPDKSVAAQTVRILNQEQG